MFHEKHSNDWCVEYEPRGWQIEALKRWKVEKNGVIKVVTGGGKTVFAEFCMAEFIGQFPGGRVIILVPTIALLDQWYIALQEELGVRVNDIGLLPFRSSCEEKRPIIISTLNSARERSEELSSQQPSMLVVDECHRAGSKVNARALRGNYVATLGLSATPERQYDDGFSELVEPRLGPIIFEYGYVEAAKDGVLAPFEIVNVQVDFLPHEAEDYSSLSRKLAAAISRSDNPGSDNVVQRLAQSRARVAAQATMRIPVAAKIIEDNRKRRAVVFHESIAGAREIFNVLRQRGHSATMYHSEIGQAMRWDNLRLFKRGHFDVLVCCRALDEGLNVPNAELAVIAASTASTRQRIQRLGRILRKAPGKEMATIFTLFTTKVEGERLAAEAKELEGLSEISWKKGARSISDDCGRPGADTKA